MGSVSLASLIRKGGHSSRSGAHNATLALHCLFLRPSGLVHVRRCILGAPLFLGTDVRNMTAMTAATVGNLEAIAIDQDPLGVQVRVHM